jgi:hypothetical protein
VALTPPNCLISPRTLKLIAVGYALKTLLLGLAWLIVPDLPARAATKARQTWAAVAGRPSAPSEPAVKP